MTDTGTAEPPDLLTELRLAIADPASLVQRIGCCSQCGETTADWQARAAAEAVRPFLAGPPAHDPEVNCDCNPDWPPGTVKRCEYALLSDAVIEAFNPPDGEDAQVAICIDAVNRARDALAAAPCACTPEMIEDWDQCPRCAALGQRGGKAVQR